MPPWKSHADWTPDGYLPRSLLLTEQPDLSVLEGTIEVAAGLPYRITGERGSIVRIEVTTEDGDIVTGHTVRGRLVSRHRSWWKFWRRR